MSKPKQSRQEKQPLFFQQYNIPNPDDIALNIGLRNLKGFLNKRQVAESETQNDITFRKQE